MAHVSTAAWSTGEAVTVNTRALIDKVLARYSAEHTVLRELFQNAADANAKKVVLKWESYDEELPARGSSSHLTCAPEYEPDEKSRLKHEEAGGSHSRRSSRSGPGAGAHDPMDLPPPYYGSKPVAAPPEKLSVPEQKQAEPKRKRSKSIFEKLKNTLNRSSNPSLRPPSSPSSSSATSPSSSAAPKFSTGSKGRFSTVADPDAYASSPAIVRDLIFERPVGGEKPKRRLYKRLIVHNDGWSFGDDDWNRLKCIAEGNPDEDKIGAFGVGFYSVFSECDEPAVFSAGKAMAFYWDKEVGGGNQLMTRTAVSDLMDDGLTTFNLPYRTPSPLPDIPELLRFLATSLIFVHLETIEVVVDGLKLFAIHKSDMGRSTPMQIVPKHGASHDSTSDTSVDSDMRIKVHLAKIEVRDIEMTASYIPGIFGVENEPQSENEKEKEKATPVFVESVELEVTIGHLSAVVGSKMTTELTRAILKPPPKNTTISMVSSANLMAELYKEPVQGGVFSRILPPIMSNDSSQSRMINEPGRVFIGFQTHQTTGFQCHFSTHSVIPTVERENIDFSARHVKEWNTAILQAVGELTKCMYHYDMTRLCKTFGHSTDGIEVFKKIMQKYAFRESTPASIVGQIIQEAFFESGPRGKGRSHDPTNCFVVMTSCGVTAVDKAFLPVSKKTITSGNMDDCDWMVERFLGLPFITQELFEASPVFVRNLFNSNILKLKCLSIDDITRELKASQSMTMEASRWNTMLLWIANRKNQDQEIPREEMVKMLKAVKVDLNKGWLIQNDISLSSITNYIKSSDVLGYSNLPTPRNCIPQASLWGHLNSDCKAIESIFRWTELGATDWLRFIVSDRVIGNKFLRPNHAESINRRVLKVLDSLWRSLSKAQRENIRLILENKACIQTKDHGMMTPGQVYLPGTPYTDGLPVVHDDLAPGPKSISNEPLSMEFWQGIGLRRDVKLKDAVLKLTREISNHRFDTNGQLQGYQVEVMNCLRNIKDKVSSVELTEVMAMEFCSVQGDNSKLHAPCTVHQAREEFRALGLPTIVWHEDWPLDSRKTEKLFDSLGVKSKPNLNSLALRASILNDKELRERALTYMMDFWETNNYGSDYTLLTLDLAFIPVNIVDGSGSDIATRVSSTAGAPLRPFVSRLEKPIACYLDDRLHGLGFPVVQNFYKPLARRLGVHEFPDLDKLIDKLITTPPQTVPAARPVFSLMYDKLKTTPFKRDSKGKMMGRDLADFAIIPVLRRDVERTIPGFLHDPSSYGMCFPPRCFLSATTTPGFDRLFNVTDFDDEARSFLLKLGIQDSPGDMDLYLLMIVEPAKVLEALGIDEYEVRLKQIAKKNNGPAIFKSEYALEQMPYSKFLIAELEDDSSAIDDVQWNEGQKSARKNHVLACARDVMVIDDFIAYKSFAKHILSCPFDAKLEEFYVKLGARKLSECIQKSHIIGPEVNNPFLAQTIQKLIFERTPLYFHEMQAEAQCDIRKWLRKLKVIIVKDIKVERKMVPQFARYLKDAGEKLGFKFETSFVQQTTAALPAMYDGERVHGNVLVVIEGFEWYDVAFEMLHRLCWAPKLGGIVLLEVLLKEEVVGLIKRGYNVRKILMEQQTVEEVSHVLVSC